MVPLLVHAVLVMPVVSHPILTNTSIKLLGNLIDWLQENKQYQGLSYTQYSIWKKILHDSTNVLRFSLIEVFADFELLERFNLEPCVTWLLDKMQKPCFVRAASESLYGICEKCESNCLDYFDSIFAIIPLLESGESKGQQLENSILLLLQGLFSFIYIRKFLL